MKISQELFDKTFKDLNLFFVTDRGDMMRQWEDKDQEDPFVNLYIDSIEEKLEGLSFIPPIKHNPSEALFSKGEENIILLPFQSCFDSKELYYRAKFHEMFHAIGIPLERKTLNDFYDVIDEVREYYEKNPSNPFLVFFNMDDNYFKFKKKKETAYYKEEIVVEFAALLLMEHWNLSSESSKTVSMRYARLAFENINGSEEFLKYACEQSRIAVEFLLTSIEKKVETSKEIEVLPESAIWVSKHMVRK